MMCSLVSQNVVPASSLSVDALRTEIAAWRKKKVNVCLTYSPSTNSVYSGLLADLEDVTLPLHDDVLEYRRFDMSNQYRKDVLRELLVSKEITFVLYGAHVTWSAIFAKLDIRLTNFIDVQAACGAQPTDCNLHLRSFVAMGCANLRALPVWPLMQYGGKSGCVATELTLISAAFYKVRMNLGLTTEQAIQVIAEATAPVRESFEEIADLGSTPQLVKNAFLASKQTRRHLVRALPAAFRPGGHLYLKYFQPTKHSKALLSNCFSKYGVAESPSKRLCDVYNFVRRRNVGGPLRPDHVQATQENVLQGLAEAVLRHPSSQSYSALSQEDKERLVQHYLGSRTTFNLQNTSSTFSPLLHSSATSLSPSEETLETVLHFGGGGATDDEESTRDASSQEYASSMTTTNGNNSSEHYYSYTNEEVDDDDLNTIDRSPFNLNNDDNDSAEYRSVRLYHEHEYSSEYDFSSDYNYNYYPASYGNISFSECAEEEHCFRLNTSAAESLSMNSSHVEFVPDCGAQHE